MDYQDLFDICKNHESKLPEVVVPQPYIPYFSSTRSCWNGILLLAEAQNLGVTESAYRSYLETACREERYLDLWNRLNQQSFWDDGDIGIGPWDDGTMKLTFAAIRSIDALKYIAVSNAVPWSASKGGATDHITFEMIKAGVDFWKDMLAVLKPEEIITFGPNARQIIQKAGFPKHQIICLPGAFTRKLNVGFKMDTNRLLKAFPEVEDALNASRVRFKIKNEILSIYCACASVSHVLASSKRNLFK